MVHLLLQGPVPYVEEGLQDRVMTYSTFSGGEVRKAANEGRAYYLPCTLANLASLIGKGRTYEPDVVFLKVRQSEITGEYSLGKAISQKYKLLRIAYTIFMVGLILSSLLFAGFILFVS